MGLSIRSIKISTRVNELAIKSDDTKSPDTLSFFAEEVDSLIERASEVVNTQFNGKYLLSGTAEQSPAFTFERDEDGRITGAIYEGNGRIRSVESSPGTWCQPNGLEPMTALQMNLGLFRMLIWKLIFQRLDRFQRSFNQWRNRHDS